MLVFMERIWLFWKGNSDESNRVDGFQEEETNGWGTKGLVESEFGNQIFCMNLLIQTYILL